MILKHFKYDRAVKFFSSISLMFWCLSITFVIQVKMSNVASNNWLFVKFNQDIKRGT